MKSLIACLVVLMLVSGYAGWFFGARQEKEHWMKFYKEAITKTCYECAGIPIPPALTGDGY